MIPNSSSFNISTILIEFISPSAPRLNLSKFVILCAAVMLCATCHSRRLCVIVLFDALVIMWFRHVISP